LEDVRILCRACHDAIHRGRPLHIFHHEMKVAALRERAA
jgi:hypothetical protein